MCWRSCAGDHVLEIMCWRSCADGYGLVLVCKVATL